VQRTGLWTQTEHKPKKCSQTDACTRPVGCQPSEDLWWIYDVVFIRKHLTSKNKNSPEFMYVFFFLSNCFN
jgi:hypothetical protein